MLRDLPADEKPRERLRALGAKQLSNPELIAILLRTGIKGENVLSMSTRVIAGFGGLAGLARSSFAELCETNGISEAKACQILAAFELGRRAASLLPDDRAMIRTPADIHNLLGAEMAVASQEKLKVVLLNAKAEVISVQEVYQGTVDSTQLRVAEVLRPAVRENCPEIIIVHNHPSGDPTPSPDDILITRNIKQCAEMMDIRFNDHVIIGSRGFVSMRERMGW
ncbi:MAG: DNA repair protein RadC [Chloroflexi bacterium]|nr:DNA repair protein RadC [Chloroflexota bacterium]